MMVILKSYIFLSLITSVLCLNLTGYKCDYSVPPFQVYSLNDVKQCHKPKVDAETTTEQVAIIHTEKRFPVSTFRCKIDIFATISGCGFNSYSYPVNDGLVKYTANISSTECLTIVKTGRWVIGSHELTGIRLNREYTKSINYANKVDNKCTDDNTFVLNGKTYKDAYADLVVTIQTKIIKVQYDIVDKFILLPDGSYCETDVYNCLDDSSYTYVIPDIKGDLCFHESTRLVYHGFANITRIKDHGDSTTYVSWDLYGNRYYTSILHKDNHCHGWITKVNNVQIYLDFASTETEVHHLSSVIKSYTEADIAILEKLFIENRFETEEMNINTLYSQSEYDQCMRRYWLIRNLFSDAKHSSNINVYDIISEEGYSGIISGELLYIFKCASITVELRATDNCYRDFPVMYNHTNYYLTTQNRILMEKSDILPCDEHFLPSLRINDNWYTYYKKIHLVHEPNAYDPNTPINDHKQPLIRSNNIPIDSHILNKLTHEYIYRFNANNMRVNEPDQELNDNLLDYDQVLDRTSLTEYFTDGISAVSGWWNKTSTLVSTVITGFIVLTILIVLLKLGSWTVKIYQVRKMSATKKKKDDTELSSVTTDKSNKLTGETSANIRRPKTRIMTRAELYNTVIKPI